MPSKLSGASYLPQDEFIARLKQDFPHVFSDGKIDPVKLKANLKDIADFDERYGLSWKGKSNVFNVIQSSTTNTLHPQREESVNFDTTDNLFIEGDNLEALKILQRSYYGKIKMIYIDPPYNTGNDFVYNDNFRQSRSEYDEGVDMVSQSSLQKNTKDSGHYHSNWLNMMYPRLYLARNLLRDDGVIFVSIDDNEVHNLRLIMNEIFGEENSLTESPTALIWQQSGSTAGHFANAHEYILCYTKSKAELPFFCLLDYGDDSVISHGALKKISSSNPASQIDFPVGIDFEGGSRIFEGEIGGSEKQIIEGKLVFENGKLAQPVKITAGWAMRNQVISWLAGEETYDTKGQKIIRFFFNSEGLLWYEKERGTIHPKTILDKEVGTTKTGSVELRELMNLKIFDYPKPTTLLKYLYSFTTHGADIILDLFAGSGTTAHAVMDLNAEDGGNRKWICVQLDEKTDETSEVYKAGYKTISDIARERIRRAGAKIGKWDVGFKSLKIDETNMKIWDTAIADPTYLETQLLLMQNPVKDGVDDESLLLELMIKTGVEPTTKYEKIGGYYQVGSNLVICLTSTMTEDIWAAILKAKPQKLIVLDSSFAGNDQLKTNLILKAEKENVEIVVV